MLVIIEKLLILHIVAFMPLEITKQLLSNSNLEKVNLLNNPNVNPKNGVAYQKNVYSSEDEHPSVGPTLLKSIKFLDNHHLWFFAVWSH